MGIDLSLFDIRRAPRAPESPENALMRGLEIQRARQGNALQALQMQAYEQAQREAAAQRADLQRVAQSIPSPQMAASQNALAAGGGPTVANAARIQPADPRLQMLHQIMQQSGGRVVSPVDYLKQANPEPDYKVVGDALVKIGPTGVSEAYKGDKGPKLPAAVQEYEYAKAQGYGGTFEQWDTARKRAGATNVSLSNPAPKAFWGDLGKQQSEVFFKEREGAVAAGGVLSSVAEIRKAAQGGAYQGAGAQLKLGAAKALGALGMPYDEKTVANSEVFDAQANTFVLSLIKQLGANPSNADLAFIRKTVPQLSTDPAALPRLLDFMEQRARGVIRSFNDKAGKVKNDPNAPALPFDLNVPEPPAGSDIDALVNQYRSKK